MKPFLILLAGYALGSIPVAFLAVRLARNQDIRRLGSGNIGAANVVRTSGWTLGLLVLALDAGKGYLAVWLAERLAGNLPAVECGAALAAILGHMFPPWLKFRGGKGVATFFGAFLRLTPLPALGAAVLWVIVAAVTRYSSAGSMAAVATFPLGVFLIIHPPWVVLAAAIAAAVLILWKHKENYRRLREGTERRIFPR